jgi:hypothetical protein
VEDITDLQDPDFDENPPQNHANDLLEEGFFMLEEDLGLDSEDKIEDKELEDKSMDKPVTDAEKKNGMYIDGHEREDVVDYCKKFVQQWKEYEKRFVIYDNEGQVVSQSQGFAVPGVHFRLILIMHDESTFYENDRRKTKWIHKKEKAVAEKKGEGQSIMVSDFLTVE